MTISFDRPIGAPADVKELEYISALHQTKAKFLRANGSIHAKDIQKLLSSRHGLVVRLEAIHEEIMDRLAGDLESEADEVMDICQVTAILLIPHLLREGQDSDLVSKVLSFMLNDLAAMTGGNNSSSNLNVHTDGAPALTRSLLRSLLESYGEFDAPDDLLDSMIRHASSSSSPRLDAATLRHAITADVGKHYSSDWDARVTTHFDDVGIFRPVLMRSDTQVSNKASRHLLVVESDNDDDDDNDDGGGGEDPNDDEEPIEDAPKSSTPPPRREDSTTTTTSKKPFRRMITLAFIDTIADTMRSRTFTVVLWAFFVMSYFSYFADVTINFGRLDCGSTFGCKVANGIVNWLVIFLQLSLLGTAFIVLGSVGNSLKGSKKLAISSLIIGIAAMVVLGILPFLYEIRTQFFDTEKEEEITFVSYFVALALGCFVIVMQLMQFISEIFEDVSRLNKNGWLDVFFTAGTRKLERQTKQAATFKVNQLVQNALSLHTQTLFSSSAAATAASRRNHMNQSTALINFQTRELHTERVGGLFWGWKRVWDKSIFVEEGVWLHSRLVACVAAQLIVCLIQIFSMTFLLVYIESLTEYIEDQTPEGETPIVYSWEVAVAGSFGIVAGIAATFGIAVVYIPSFISTVLQFRSGVIPSLRSQEFLCYRFAIDQTSILLGSSFWGALFTAAVMTLIVGGVVFFVAWHITREIALTLVGQIIGVICTVVLKVGILIIFRASFYAGFYRKKPAPTNCVNVVMECWSLGLSAGYMLARTCKLLLIAAMFLGRMDVPFLAPGAGVIGPVILDAYPVAFRKDLLVHEAHRHPYLERLAAMYMLQLKHGKDFATRAGSCWRLLFVLALMPWLRRYRVRFVGDALERELAKVDELLMEEEDNGDIENENEDNEEVLDRRQALQTRRASLRTLQDRAKLAAGNREELLEREIEMLKDELALAKNEVEAMKMRIDSSVTGAASDGEFSDYDGEVTV